MNNYKALCQAAGYEIHDVLVGNDTDEKHYWLHKDAEPHEHGEVFATEEEMWEDCYNVNIKGQGE